MTFFESPDTDEVKIKLLVQQLNSSICHYRIYITDKGRPECKRSILSWAPEFCLGYCPPAEYRCPMNAAGCLAAMGTKAKHTLPDIEKAKSAKPPTFSTGDGTVEYRRCFEYAIKALNDDEGSKTMALAVCRG